MSISSVSWIVKWQVVVVSQVRRGMRCKNTGRDNGLACHNSVTKEKFLSLAASGNVQESQATIVLRVPLLCNDVYIQNLQIVAVFFHVQWTTYTDNSLFGIDVEKMNCVFTKP